MNSELANRLLKAARSAEPVLGRGQLLPYREALITFRARGFSYEGIVAELKKHGIEVASSTVGCFCRRHCSRAAIQRVRVAFQSAASTAKPEFEVHPLVPLLIAHQRPSGRGPRTARDDL